MSFRIWCSPTPSPYNDYFDWERLDFVDNDSLAKASLFHNPLKLYGDNQQDIDQFLGTSVSHGFDSREFAEILILDRKQDA